MERFRRFFGKDKTNIHYPQHQGDYRPEIIAAPSGDELHTAGRQAMIDQKAEEIIAIRDGEHRQAIYTAAEALVDATEFLGMKKRKSLDERRLDVERVAFGIAAGRNDEDVERRRATTEEALRPFFEKATNETRRKYMEERVVPAFYRAHGIEPPSPSR